jgi:hypothetical protein
MTEYLLKIILKANSRNEVKKNIIKEILLRRRE